MGPVPVSPRKTPEKKGVPWARDAGMPEEGSATALKGRRQDGGTGHWAQDRDRSVLKEGRLLPAIQGGVGRVAPRGPQGCPSCGDDIWGLCSKPQSLTFWNWKIAFWAQSRLLEGLKHRNLSSPSHTTNLTQTLP